MTEREMHRLSRKVLLEMLLEQRREAEELKEWLAKRQLENRRILIDEAGSIAEVALKLNRFYGAAQQAAIQYLENIGACAEEFEEEVGR